jgi:leucyl aminopeptidase
MEIPYRHTEKIKINQSAKDATTARVDTRDVALMILPEKPGPSDWQRIPWAEVLEPRYRRMQRRDPDNHRLVTDLPNRNGTLVVVQAIDPQSSSFELLSLGRTLAAALHTRNPATLLLQPGGFAAPGGARVVEALLAAILASVCPMPSYKSKPATPAALKHIEIFGLEAKLELATLRAEIGGNHLARWLSALPANELTPARYRKFVAALAEQEGWQMRFLDSRALRRKKAGAFLAVAQASPVDDAGIVLLRYRRGRGSGKRLALVGKGICFDTGGVNLKPAKHMHGMHEDMQGSAVALGTLLALSRIKPDCAIDCWLALAQNHIGNQAYKPNDVVTACNGTSIEVVHTDAEGRMVLADTLAIASREKPLFLIDYATLTGACIYALSSRYSGVFSNRASLHDALIAAGRDSGERVWPFPLDADYDEPLKSTLADIRQCTLEGEADHILAARFLKRFVADAVHWIHVDLAAGNHEGGLAHIPTATTGFGIRFTLNLIRQQGVLEKSWS